MWSSKKLTELNPIEFYQILKLRIDTFVVEQGRIIERGNHEELLEKKGRYYRLYTGKQA